jgi:alkylation response protein AidB-like acyl-CoA dehydrogenase
MSFMLTEEQMMIQAMVREFARKEILPTAMERDKNKAFPSEHLKKMGQLGLLGVMVPVQYNGEGADTISYVLALAEIAYACASTAVIMSVHNSIVCESILKYGTKAQKNTFLNKLAGGRIIGAFAMTEPAAGSDPAGQSTSAILKGDAYIINGTKRFITTAKHSGLVIVTAKTDENAGHKGISAFIVEKGAPGLVVGKEEEKMGLRASDTCDLIFF